MSYIVTAPGLETAAEFNDIARAYAFRSQLIKLGYQATVKPI